MEITPTLPGIVNVPPESLGIFFAGGGLRGIYQVGTFPQIRQVIKKYREYCRVKKMVPRIKVGGLSVGAIHGASLVAHDFNHIPILKVWSEIEQKGPTEVFQYTSAFYWIAKHGMPPTIYRQGPLRKLIAHLDTETLVKKDIPYFVAVHHVDTNDVIYLSSHDQEMQEDPLNMSLAIMASCSILGAFPPVLIKHHGVIKRCADGGHKWPLPLKKVFFKEGCDTVIVVRCHSNRVLKPMRDIWVLDDHKASSDETITRQGEEIRRILETGQPLNLFDIAPSWLPKELDTVTFKNGDFLKAYEAGRADAEKELGPLEDYFDAQIHAVISPDK